LYHPLLYTVGIESVMRIVYGSVFSHVKCE
jgi:hypothetical protein